MIDNNLIHINRFSSGFTFLSQEERIISDKPIEEGSFIPPTFKFTNIINDSITVSRLIAKIAFESFALKFIDEEGWLDYLIDDPSFDNIRNYVRMGSDCCWSYNVRKIYPSNKKILCSDGSLGQIVHESDFLMLPASFLKNDDLQNGNDFYIIFVAIIWGLEFAMNIAGPDPDGLEPYKIWLEKHNNISPLYTGMNKDFIFK